MSKGGPAPTQRRRMRFVRWRRWIKPFISRRTSPEAIAGGMALGFIITFTPTLGVQIILAYTLATILHASRAAALLPIWITTPVTATPIYMFTYKIGAYFVGGPSAARVRERLRDVFGRAPLDDGLSWLGRLQEAAAIGTNILIPLWLGGLLLGGLLAALSYPITLWLVRHWRGLRERRRRVRQWRFRRLRLRRRDRPHTT